jgi:hypothetical protein
MSCKTQSTLTQAWLDANDRFSDAIRAMTGDHIGRISKAEYMALRGQAEEARLASENARLLIEIHRQEHGC